MASLASSLIYPQDLTSRWRPEGCLSKLLDQPLLNCKHLNLSFRPMSPRRAKLGICRRQINVRAGLSGNSGRPSSASVFVGGFLLGGIVAGALSYVYAPKVIPKITKVLDGADKKDLMRKLPKFIYDEDKALEKTRKILEEKIAQLNSAIDGVSSELQTDDAPNEAISDEIQASI